MAKTVSIQLTDDLDGTEAVEEVTFALRGVGYEIDLNAKNAAALDKALAKFVHAGRRVPKPRASRSRSVAPRSDVPEIREWAAANGFTVSSRGRIPAEERGLRGRRLS